MAQHEIILTVNIEDDEQVRVDNFWFIDLKKNCHLQDKMSGFEKIKY